MKYQIIFSGKYKKKEKEIYHKNITTLSSADMSRDYWTIRSDHNVLKGHFHVAMCLNIIAKQVIRLFASLLIPPPVFVGICHNTVTDPITDVNQQTTNYQATHKRLFFCFFFFIETKTVTIYTTKTHLSNILKISPPKTESFQIKILIFFIFLLKT